MRRVKKILFALTIAFSSIAFLTSCEDFLARVKEYADGDNGNNPGNTDPNPNPNTDEDPDPDTNTDPDPTTNPTENNDNNEDYSNLMNNNKIKPTRDETYYASCRGLKGETLKNALHNIIKGHTTYEYNGTMNSYLKRTDVDPDNPSNIILTYQGSVPSSTAFNKEHTWAKSHGSFGETRGVGSDLHNIRPCNENLNSTRGNLDFGTVSSHVSTNNISKYSWATSDMSNNFINGTYFEPKDEFKGDIARIIFYMATRYEKEDNYDLEVGGVIPSGFASFVADSTGRHGNFKDLYEWATSGLDPVSNFEMNRNNVIDSNYQHNRNPFIDHPEFIIMIYDQNYNGPGALM
ncbi:MAG: endonuclease [Bacilli bacterium]|nr:endonuclease [Bacilli bacterium]